MSTSRLEKFIYAICSMDVSDLPVPLSRIEKLWNCLITGETPDFEPISRNEKYLMAMLDRYDISNLPTPMSRGEKLLYKIAVGETDLSDVPGYLSRYEELLKYLIENGVLSDFEYVLYTLNQSLSTLYSTVEKPVKSAILSGQTLVNLVKNKEKVTLSSDGGSTYTQYCLTQTVKPNSRYLSIVNYSNNTSSINTEMRSIFLAQNAFATNNWLTKKPIDCNGVLKTVITTIDTPEDSLKIGIASEFGGSVDVSDVMLIEYQEGMENWDIPYFTGMQSVKMPVLTTIGKNLFNFQGREEYCYYNSINGLITPHQSVDSYCVEVRQNTTYTITVEGRKSLFHITFWDKNLNFISGESAIGDMYQKTFTTPSKTCYVKFSYHRDGISSCQLEQGNTSTTYEPFKSNILTVNEEVELRGIGNVRDTLDLMSGEVTQRIGELVLDGSGEWKTDINGAGVRRYFLEGIGGDLSDDVSNSSSLLCDKFKASSNMWIETNDAIQIIKSNGIFFIDSSVDSLDAFVNKLKATNIKVQYSLIEKPVKTVDLTVVDQDNQPIQLGTFENVTHVSLKAENLIPEVEMEVATNLLEDTVFNLTDAFNTLYPTAAKQVVDGMLYGQTLLSVSNYTFLTGKYLDIYRGGFNTGGENHRYVETYFSIPTEAKTITLKGNNIYKKICYYDANKKFIIGHALQTANIDDFKTDIPTNASYYRFNTSITNNPTNTIDEYLHVYIDGILYLTNKSDYREGAKLFTCKSPGVTITNEDNTKSITLSTTSDLELRKIGKVQDELNVMTGEVVERIEGITFNSSDGWELNDSTFKSIYEFRYLLNKKGVNYIGFANNFPQASSGDYERFNVYNRDNRTYLYLCISKSKISSHSLDALNEYLQVNPLVIQYQLTTPTTKTVDLTVVNQDGNETKLRTFDDTTHVLLESEGLTPTASLTVRTKIPSASSTSLLMDDISTKQEQLNTTVDEQSNNVDATMIATTEIYEETL